MENDRAIEPEYDVVIVGGRPAGASLAARLGERGVKVLVVDRARFPSLPSVPSCPLLYPPAMALLDELGIDERLYGDESSKSRRFVIELGDHFDTHLDMIRTLGRDYLYGIDRARFDLAVWDSLARHPSVTARQGVGLIDLMRDEAGRVIGVECRTDGGESLSIRARCVVGADGRFSLVARKAGARVLEDYADRTSTVHYAFWEDVVPYDEDTSPRVHIHATGRGADVLFFPMPERRTVVCTHLRSDRVHVEGDAEGFYLRKLDSFAGVRRRLKGARRVTPVVGMKRVGNRLLSAGGPGWVLTGDALHHKDPVDGQGIYDALIESKLLALELHAWLAGRQTFEQALAAYERRVREETHGMFLASMERLKRELYDEPPELVMKTVLRWLVTDEEYKQRLVLFLSRAIPPETWFTPSLMRRAILRGALGDVRRLLRWGRAS